jgi:TetR/AcrR family acrAB operon transcriptional repressor
VYWHFKNKNGVLISLLEEICDNTERNFYQIGMMPGSFSDLRVFFKKKLLAKSEERVQKANKLLHRMHEWPDEVARNTLDSIKNMAKREMEFITELVSKSQARGEIRDDMPSGDIAGLMSAVFYGMVVLQLHGLYNMDFVKYADLVFSSIEKEFARGNVASPGYKTT